MTMTFETRSSETSVNGKEMKVSDDHQRAEHVLAENMVSVSSTS